LHDDILDNIELESGESREKDSEFNLDEVVQSLISLQRPVALSKRLVLKAEIDESTPCHLRGLRQSLERSLLNLIGNALKFTEKGSVSVMLSMANESERKYFSEDEKIILKVQVKDTGIGIPKDKFNEIFEKFNRLTPSYKGIYKGLGLGLYVVKKYVEAMHGKIEVESKLENGSCFTMYLPFLVEKEGKTQLKTIHENPVIKEVVVEKKGVGHHRVLLVEDDKLASMAIRSNLSKLDCEVDWAQSGEEALDKIEKNDYHIVFMDIGLPAKSGVDVAREVRQHNNSKKSAIPIVALTGHARGKIRQFCLNVGMQSVLSKPANLDDLKKALNYFSKKPGP
jgi:CheY-like chemotaxis protein